MTDEPMSALFSQQTGQWQAALPVGLDFIGCQPETLTHVEVRILLGVVGLLGLKQMLLERRLGIDPDLAFRRRGR